MGESQKGQLEVLKSEVIDGKLCFSGLPPKAPAGEYVLRVVSQFDGKDWSLGQTGIAECQAAINPLPISIQNQATPSFLPLTVSFVLGLGAGLLATRRRSRE